MGGFARLRLLLDTHIWLWSALDPQKLGLRVRTELEDDTNELWLSPISLWEAMTLSRKGRLNIPGERHAWMERASSRFREAPLTREIVLTTASLLLSQGDPADLLLAATAKALGLTLVTADQKLLGLGDVNTLANR